MSSCATAKRDSMRGKVVVRVDFRSLFMRTMSASERLSWAGAVVEMKDRWMSNMVLVSSFRREW